MSRKKKPTPSRILHQGFGIQGRAHSAGSGICGSSGIIHFFSEAYPMSRTPYAQNTQGYLDQTLDQKIKWQTDKKTTKYGHNPAQPAA